MAYSANTHNIWVGRVKDLAAKLDSIAFREGDILDEIYTNQGGNVNPETWTDTDEATKTELIAVVTLIRDLQAFLNGSSQPAQLDRRPTLAPFIQ